MPAPRRIVALLPLLAVVAAGAGGCGGGHSKPTVVKTVTSASGQRSYKVKLPSGKVVIQAHSPALAEPPKGLQATQTQSLVGTVEQYDSVTTSTIPRSAHYVAGYVNGLYANYRQMVGRWPVVVGISVTSTGGADCFDMEPGNPGPTNAAPWAIFQFAAGNSRPCEYSMLSWMPSIRANLAQHGIPICTSSTSTRCVRLWDANWTYSRHLDAGYACTQWTDHANGLNLDESTCAGWFHTAPKPPPPPLPKCYTHRIAKAQCDTARAQVKAAARGAQQSLDAYRARGCDVLKAREHWFANAIATDHSARGKARLAYRKGALATTRKVEGRLACGVFAGRVSYFGALQTRIERAN